MIGSVSAPFFVLMILVILIIGIFGGTKAREEENKSNSGMYVCSPTGEEINKKCGGLLFLRQVLRDKANKYIEIAEKQGIDPVLFAAISLHETAWGKSSAVTKIILVDLCRLPV